ncbi:MAG: FG-GAP-like repeat-containing protein, partial [Planctomycetota bacterium]
MAVALGDVDGDGDLDGFLGIGAPFSLSRLYRNDGRGAFTDVTQASLLPVLADPIRAVSLGDLDGDGDLDSVVGVGWDPNVSMSTGPSRRYANNGAGVFTLASFPAQIEDTRAVALGDVDGDGDLDAFMGISGGPYGGGQNRLYRNLGAGTFADVTATSLPALADMTRAVALGDVDGDGDLDAYVGNGGHPALLSPQQNRLLLNGGTGAFADVTPTNLPAVLDQTIAVALGDIDGDGDLDAFVGNYGQERLHLNGGTGVFTDVSATNLPPVFDQTNAVTLLDADGDGDLDGLVGNLNSYFLNPQSTNRLLQNGGMGVFTDVTAVGLPSLVASTYALAVGDVDGDGDSDAFVGTADLARIYTNLTRQLSWRGIPRVGTPLALDLQGPANGTWLLAASAGSAAIPLPPFGTLRLFPTTLFIVAGGVLDPQGRASLT